MSSASSETDRGKPSMVGKKQRREEPQNRRHHQVRNLLQCSIGRRVTLIGEGVGLKAVALTFNEFAFATNTVNVPITGKVAFVNRDLVVLEDVTVPAQTKVRAANVLASSSAGVESFYTFLTSVILRYPGINVSRSADGLVNAVPSPVILKLDCVCEVIPCTGCGFAGLQPFC